METIQPIPQSPQPSSKNPYKILFFVILGLFLFTISLLVFVWFKKSTPTKSEDNVENKPIETEIVSEITPTITEQITPTKIVDPSGWTTYNSKELGLSFKYPNSWGSPETVNENRQNYPSFSGQSYCVYFFANRVVSICGYTNDYKYFNGRQPISNEENLDLAEVFNQEQGDIFFIKKTIINNQKTSIKTEFLYMPEAGGVLIRSNARFRGKTKYSSLYADAVYRNFEQILDKYYDDAENKGLEPAAIKILTELKNGTSQDKEMTKLYKDYQTLLSSIKFN